MSPTVCQERTFSLNNISETLNNSDTLFSAFIISVALLLLVSLFKYFLSKECEKEDWGHLILEFPIDICLVLITVIITGYMEASNLPYTTFLVVVSLIISIICCILRRLSIKSSYNEENLLKTLLYGLANVLLGSLWVCFTCKLIF